MNRLDKQASASGSGTVMARKNEDGVEQGESRYGEELLSANWNPVIELLEASGRKPAAKAAAAAPDWRAEDVDAFLGRIYRAGN